MADIKNFKVRQWLIRQRKIDEAKELLKSVRDDLNDTRIDCECCDRWFFEDFAEGETHRIVDSIVQKCGKAKARMLQELELEEDTAFVEAVTSQDPS